MGLFLRGLIPYGTRDLAGTSNLKKDTASFFNSSMALCQTQLTSVTVFTTTQAIFVGLLDLLQKVLLESWSLL